MPKVKIYSRFNTPVIPGLSCTDKTRTQQHFRNECDINMIVQRAINTGNTQVFTTTQRAQYYDCSAYSDYQSALEMLDNVADDFYSLPSRIRKEFGNDPDKYVSFMSDPRNAAKAVELGLLEGSGETQPAKPASKPEQPAAATETAPKGSDSEPKATP